MKTILLIFFSLISSTFGQNGTATFNANGPVVVAIPPAGSQQLNFANVNSQSIVASLPTSVTNIDGTLNTAPDIVGYWNAGWRTVVQPVPTPVGGIYSASQYTIHDNGDGTCSLLINTNQNVTLSLVYQITNSLIWNANFTNYLATGRSIQRSYTGYGSETNAVVNTITSGNYFATNPTFLKTSFVLSNIAYSVASTNVFPALFLINQSVLIDSLPGITNTAQFWQIVNQYQLF